MGQSPSGCITGHLGSAVLHNTQCQRRVSYSASPAFTISFHPPRSYKSVFVCGKMYMAYRWAVTLPSWETKLRVSDLCQAGQGFSSQATKFKPI